MDKFNQLRSKHAIQGKVIIEIDRQKAEKLIPSKKDFEEKLNRSILVDKLKNLEKENSLNKEKHEIDRKI